ncbi:hypothetical protein ANOM_000321 [Aspergillus nomiae NRRL 13137]|uniref:Xylanolytic transcriptional activator regulatory domain-containing protein n=1 Tax=Aspergillus nomiae NRRL (strain ATCC 15546 / NRRL 13137 / CBS 260.88 / M93) TaxID=1509407 RepID=A0A0L1JHR6_ASPN3|nr:uncharacterized protein ANOM_000321 [Aspergillus nomiae NRRL 13137]KNG91309.1 hypothetical protein ANOM_000321 [Aspergillus nomiae NRRL 13137]
MSNTGLSRGVSGLRSIGGPSASLHGPRNGSVIDGGVVGIPLRWDAGGLPVGSAPPASIVAIKAVAPVTGAKNIELDTRASTPALEQPVVPSVIAVSPEATPSADTYGETTKRNNYKALGRLAHAVPVAGHRCIFENQVAPQTDTPNAHACLDDAIDLERAGNNQNDPRDQIDHYIQLYFARFHPRWPFLHRATFGASHEPTLLLYAVVMIGMWVSGKDTCRRSALDLHRRLGTCIRQQQTCLRHNVFFYPAMVGRYHDIDDVTCIWVGVEEIKRLGLALYKVCNRCRSARQGELDGDSNSRLLCLSDLRFPAPDSNHLWEAKSNPELSNLLAQTSRGMNPEDGREIKLVSDGGGWLDDVDPGFNWI